MSVRLDLESAIDFFAQPGIARAAKAGLFSAALRGVQDIVTRIVPSRSPQPIDRAIFNASWRAVQTSEGAAIENTAPHAPYIEFGVKAENVKAGRKMIDALTEWVIRKGIAPSGDVAFYGGEARRAAWAIAMSMKRKGIFRDGAGLRILDQFNRERRDKFIKAEVGREIRNLFRNAKALKKAFGG